MLWILSEGQEIGVYIRTGNIDLQHIHRLLSQSFHYCQIFFRGMSADINDYLCIKLLKIGNVPFAEHLNSRILEADGVHHPAVDFCNTRGRIPCPGNICHALGDHCSQLV